MATPTIGELLALLEQQQARIERLEAAAAAPVAGLAARGTAGTREAAARARTRVPAHARRA